MIDPTERFSDRVENYIRYRPHYPVAVLDCLRAECELQPSSVIADIGSGTGILTALFLGNGNTVYAVEPNRSMREAGEQFVGHHPHFSQHHRDRREYPRFRQRASISLPPGAIVPLVRPGEGAGGIRAHSPPARLEWLRFGTSAWNHHRLCQRL